MNPLAALAASRRRSSILVGHTCRIERCHLAKKVSGGLHDRDSETGSSALAQSHLQVQHWYKPKLPEHSGRARLSGAVTGDKVTVHRRQTSCDQGGGAGDQPVDDDRNPSRRAADYEAGEGGNL